MLLCDHCLLEVPDDGAVRDEINGQKKIFCCHACNGIYRLIRNEGLENFYARRKEWKPGPAEDKPVDVSAFIENLRPAGQEVETDIIIDGIRCASCVWLNEKILLRTKGITHAVVNYATHRARIRWNPTEIDAAAVLNRIRSIGYTPKPFLPKAWEDEQNRQSRDLLIRFGTAAFFSMQLMLFSIALYAGYFQGIDENIKLIFHLISFALTTPVLFYSGWPIMAASFRGLRNLTFNMDVLIAAGSLSAYGYSIYAMMYNSEVYFDTAAMIVTLILLGRYIEAGAKGRASDTISKLMHLSPREARRLEITETDAGRSELNKAGRAMVPLTQIKPGHLLEVIPGERIPLDGEVVEGASEVDESMLTGESRALAKSPGHQVFGGTMNLYGSFIFRVTRAGKETVLARIIQAVEDAQARRAPIQSVADRVVGYFVPAVLFISLLTLLGWLSYGAPLPRAIMNAVSVMVIACPCALGLATPLAILIGTSHAAVRGILIKGGDVIEKAGAVDHVVLDKTGTITEGKPVLSLFSGIGISDQEALALACSLEKRSEHSLGRAIVDASKGLKQHDVLDFVALPGKGVKGIINGKLACIGNRSFISHEAAGPVMAALNKDQLRLIEENERNGATVVYLSYESALRGIFFVSDKVRQEASEAVRQIRRFGADITMVTGDNANTAGTVAQRTGIEEVKAHVSPLGKADEIRNLQSAGKKVLMAGDGINDAPGLVQANVGVAMGRATDIALESADMVIMRPDLRLIPLAMALSQKTLSVIRQNIFWAFFYNIVVIPLAVAGVLHPIIAAGAMAFSSLSVGGNSLRARVSSWRACLF